MITLRINDSDPAHMDVVEKIKSRSLAHKLVTNELQHLPVLDAHGKVFEGFDEIKKGIEELDKLMKDWYACRCDMFEG